MTATGPFLVTQCKGGKKYNWFGCDKVTAARLDGCETDDERRPPFPRWRRLLGKHLLVDVDDALGTHLLPRETTHA